MKKIFFALLICLSFGYANSPKFLGSLVESHQPVVFSCYDNHEWILGLEDGSFWKIQVLKEKRKQTWYEWWNNITPTEWLLEDSYFFDPNSWEKDFVLRVYQSEKAIFPEYTHILEHETTNQKVFAQLIPFGEKYIPSLAFADRFFDHPQGSPVNLSYIMKNTKDLLSNIIILRDNSCWRVFPFQKNSSSWTQWLRSIEVDQPDPMFVFKLQDWSLDDQIQIYFLEDDYSMNAKYNVNQLESKFKQDGLFLIKNITKKHLAYAEKTSVNQLIQSLEEHAKTQRKEGYQSGYSEGYNRAVFYERSRFQESTRQAQSSYNKGYRDGYEKAQEDQLKEERLPAYNPYEDANYNGIPPAYNPEYFEENPAGEGQPHPSAPSFSE